MLEGLAGIRGVGEQGDGRQRRDRFLEQLKSLSGQVEGETRDSGDRPAWPREARDETQPDRISYEREDNRSQGRRIPGSRGRGGAFGSQ